MFLNRLNDVEKVAFLELAHHIARSDNDFSEDQKTIIGKYCTEMQVDDINYDDEKFDIYKTLDRVKNKQSQKIILLEIMALIYSDNYLHEEEEKVLQVLLKEFGLSEELSVVYGEWSKAILSLYIQGQALIEL